MDLQFPLDLVAVLSLPGACVIAAIVGLWARDALRDWRWTPWVVLVTTMTLVMLARFVASAWQPTGEEVFMSALLGLFGVSLETFGYEAIINALGKMGYGRRSDKALNQ